MRKQNEVTGFDVVHNAMNAKSVGVSDSPELIHRDVDERIEPQSRNVDIHAIQASLAV
jgi:hypothetical protein